MAAESGTHRPRPLHPKSKQATSRSGRGSAVDVGPDGRLRPAFPLAATLWSARAGVSAWVVLSLIVMATALFRWALGCWDYSGTDVVVVLDHGGRGRTQVITRQGHPADVWRLRSPTTLDGDDDAPPHRPMVFLRPGLVGTGLSAAHGLPQLDPRNDVGGVCTRTSIVRSRG